MALNVVRASQRNAYWSRRLGWDAHYERIAAVFTSRPSTPSEFAHAVSQWQHFRRPPLEPDGILGPRSWEAMRADLGIGPPQSPRTLPAESESLGGEHYALVIRGKTVHFYDYIRLPLTAEKIAGLRRYLTRLPDVHLRALYPIFLIDRMPWQTEEQRQGGGGTWRPARNVEGAAAQRGAAARVFRTRYHEANSAVPSDDVRQLVTEARTGMIAIPKQRWQRSLAADNGPHTTVLHEIGHNIDFELGLVPDGATTRDFPGMATDTSRCGAASATARQAAEAYARLMYAPGTVIHRNGPRPARMSEAAARSAVMATLRRSRAFMHVPATWWPP